MDEFQDRRRAESFGVDAEQYERARPSYPAQLVTDLLADGTRAVLDIACGTGKAGRMFVARGCQVIGVEIDERMAALARQHLSVVDVGAFETWDADGRRFDLAVCGQAWHWIDPDVGARRLAEVVAPSGRVGLFWNVGRHEPELGARLETAYADIVPGVARSLAPVRDDDGVFLEPLAATGGFDRPERRTYPWTHYYSTRSWLEQLQTHSDHRVLPDAQRRRLLAAVADIVDDAGGVTMFYDTELITARRSA